MDFTEKIETTLDFFCWAGRRAPNHNFGKLQGPVVFGPALHGYIRQAGRHEPRGHRRFDEMRFPPLTPPPSFLPKKINNSRNPKPLMIVRHEAVTARH